jgi:alpha-1,3-glucan synthase
VHPSYDKPPAHLGYAVKMTPRASLLLTLAFTTLSTLVDGLRYDPQFVDYNINTNTTAVNPLDYWGQRDSPNYTPSPKSWRFPVYTLFIDRYVNGDPTNDNANGTLFEHDPASNQLRHGGDLQGLVDSLDYIQGMGIKAIYIAGSPFINMPWGSDAYSPLDLTLLDQHFGTVTEWQSAIDEIHKRDMYIIMDHTMAT